MTKKSELVKYVSAYLNREYVAVKISQIADVVSVLSLEEKP